MRKIRFKCRATIPEEIISQCVWLYFNLSVSLREVELMMAYRGIHLSYETSRQLCNTSVLIKKNQLRAVYYRETHSYPIVKKFSAQDLTVGLRGNFALK